MEKYSPYPFPMPIMSFALKYSKKYIAPDIPRADAALSGAYFNLWQINPCLIVI